MRPWAAPTSHRIAITKPAFVPAHYALNETSAAKAKPTSAVTAEN
jgi:hypothetical protein